MKLHHLEDGFTYTKGHVDPCEFLDVYIAETLAGDDGLEEYWKFEEWKETNLKYVKHDHLRIIPTAPSWRKSDVTERDTDYDFFVELSKPGRGAFPATILYG